MNERKTALVLSGGGSRGAYEVGVWQALIELGLKIDMACGVSAGAINAVMVAQGDIVKTTSLWRQMQTDMIFDVNQDAQIQDYAKEFFTKFGAGTTGLQKLLHTYVDEEKVRNSSVDFGLITVELPALKPHYMWIEDIPKGKLCDYITASSSAFPAIHPHRIDGKDYIDGGFENNLPVPMAWERGATDVIAIYLDAVGRFHPEQVENVPNLTFIRSKWDLGDFLVFQPENTERIMRLGYLDAMKIYDVFDGEYYTFAKGTFDKRTLKQADDAARIFQLDPLILYRREKFIEEMAVAVKKAADDMALDVDMSLSSMKDLVSLGKIKEIMKIANRRTVVLLIAQSLTAKGDDSIFLSKYAMRILSKEIRAARFLTKMNLT